MGHLKCLELLVRPHKNMCVLGSSDQRNIIFPTDVGQKAYFYQPRSEGDNVIGSVRPSVHPSVKSNKNHSQSKVFVCVSIISLYLYFLYFLSSDRAKEPLSNLVN